MKKVRRHAAVTLIQPIDFTGDLIFGIYDREYPVTVFVEHYVPIGGNANGHSSPLDTVTKELYEEFQDEHFSEETIGSLANLRDKSAYVQKSFKIGENAISQSVRINFRNAVIEDLTPIKDYLVTLDGNKVKAKEKEINFIYSFFRTKIANPMFYEVADQLHAGKELRNEGLTRVVNEFELVKGTIRGAWGASTIVGDILGLNIPEYDWIHVEPMGNLRSSYQDYKKDFSYAVDPEAKSK